MAQGSPTGVFGVKWKLRRVGGMPGEDAAPELVTGRHQKAPILLQSLKDTISLKSRWEAAHRQASFHRQKKRQGFRKFRIPTNYQRLYLNIRIRNFNFMGLGQSSEIKKKRVAWLVPIFFSFSTSSSCNYQYYWLAFTEDFTMAWPCSYLSHRNLAHFSSILHTSKPRHRRVK